MRKPSWKYRYSYRPVGSVVAAGRSDDLKRITLAATRAADRNDRRYSVYDHLENRRVFVAIPGVEPGRMA